MRQKFKIPAFRGFLYYWLLTTWPKIASVQEFLNGVLNFQRLKIAITSIYIENPIDWANFEKVIIILDLFDHGFDFSNLLDFSKFLHQGSALQGRTKVIEPDFLKKNLVSKKMGVNPIFEVFCLYLRYRFLEFFGPLTCRRVLYDQSRS